MRVSITVTSSRRRRARDKRCKVKEFLCIVRLKERKIVRERERIKRPMITMPVDQLIHLHS